MEIEFALRMFKKAVQRGRSERSDEAYSVRYVEPLSEARTKLAAFFNILHGSEERHIEGGSYHSPNASSTQAGPGVPGSPVNFLTFLWRRDP